MNPEFRNYMKELSSYKYGVDLNLKPQEENPVATYRTLDVDWNDIVIGNITCIVDLDACLEFVILTKHNCSCIYWVVKHDSYLLYLPYIP